MWANIGGIAQIHLPVGAAEVRTLLFSALRVSRFGRRTPLRRLLHTWTAAALRAALPPRHARYSRDPPSGAVIRPMMTMMTMIW